MKYFTILPKPAPGDVYVRFRDTGEHEESLIVSVQTKSGDDWTATVMCSTGFDFVGGAPERRGFEAWFPRGWIFDNETQSFRPPNTRWDDVKNEFAPADRGEAAPVTIPKPGDPGGQMAEVARPVPGLNDIPEPRQGEHILAWRARVKRANPSANLEDPRAKAIMADVWRARNGAGNGSPENSVG